MCRQQASIEAVNHAADALKAACLRICGDNISKTLKAVFSSTLVEPIPDDMLEQLRKLS